jgi:SAM-dependent methyltransferase
MNDDEILEERNRLLDSWEAAAAGWGRQADRNRETAMPISQWLVDQADPQPGQTVLELAAGPGDTGFIAAQRIKPGGTLISSDGVDAMVEVARERAQEQGIDNVEFKQLQLEWIDLPTASVDTILCRWGVMLTLDPPAALQECRRVLKPGGRLALAVWDVPDRNPWATVTQQALIALGHVEPPAPGGPGMFALSRPGQLQEMLEEAGFYEITVEPIEFVRSYRDVLDLVGETLDLSRAFNTVWTQLNDQQRKNLRTEITERARPFTDATGAIELPGSSLAAVASA